MLTSPKFVIARFFFILGYTIDENLIPMDPDNAKSRWSCAICGKDFLNKWSTRRHVETMHFESASFDCEVCGKTLKNKNSYQNHLIIMHGHRVGK